MFLPTENSTLHPQSTRFPNSPLQKSAARPPHSYPIGIFRKEAFGPLIFPSDGLDVDSELNPNYFFGSGLYLVLQPCGYKARCFVSISC